MQYYCSVGMINCSVGPILTHIPILRKKHTFVEGALYMVTDNKDTTCKTA